MKKSSYTKFQRIVAFLLFFSHTLISCSCKKNPEGDGKQEGQPNKQSKTGRSSTSSPRLNINNQTNPSATSSTPPEATHETINKPNRQPDDSISTSEENSEAYLTEEEVIDSMSFSSTEELVSSDDEEKKDDNENEAAIQDKPSYQAKSIPSDNPIPDAEHSGLATPNQPAPILFSPLLQHTPNLPLKDGNLPTNLPSTHSSKNPSNKNNPNTVTLNLFKPKPNTTLSLPTPPKKKIATISPTKKQPISLVRKQQALAQRQQQARQQRIQDLPSEYEKRRVTHEAARARLYTELEEIQQRVASKVAIERAQKKQAEEQDNLDEQDEQKDRIERQQSIIEFLIKDRQDTELRKHSLEKLMKFSPQPFKELWLEEKSMRQELHELTESVFRNTSEKGFTLTQQDSIRDEFNRLEKFIRKSQKAVSDITHLLAHPEENWDVKNGKKEPIYTGKDLIMAQEKVAALQAIRTQLENLVTSRGDSLASYQPAPRIARTVEEKQAYKHLEILFHDPANAGAIFKDLSAQADELLKQLDNQPHLRQQLLPQADLLVEQFNTFHGIIEKKALSTAELYANADPVTLATRPLKQGISRYQSLNVMENASSDYQLLLCDKFNTGVSSKNYYSEKFTGKSFRKFFDNLTALLEPGSELLTNLPKGTSLPTTAQEQATLLLDHGVKYIKDSGIAENFQGFVDKQSPLYQEAQNMLIYLIEKKKSGSPNPSRLQRLLKPFSTVSHELATADNQKEWETSYQPLVAGEFLVSAADKQKEWEAIHQQLVADELLLSAADKQKEWETSHQPVVANEPLVSAADSSALQLNTAENQQNQASKNFSEKNEQQQTNFYLREKEKVAKKELSKYLPPDLLNRLVSDTIPPPVLQEPIEQQPAYTESQPNDLPTGNPNVSFDQIRTEIDKFFSDPTHGAELVRNAQQQVQELLDQKKLNKTTRSQEEKEALQQKASGLMDLLLDLLENFNDQLNDLNSQKKSLEACNRISSLNDKIENTKKNIEITEKVACQLCYAFDITETDLKSSTSPVTPAVIEKALEKTLSLAPGKKMTKVLTGGSPAPKTPEDTFKPAAETALDFIYKYKTIKPFNKRKTGKKEISNCIERWITKIFTACSGNVFFKIITGSEPDLSFQPEFKSTAEALDVVDIYFQKPSTEPKHFREAGLYLLKQIELLKKLEKYRYRALQNAFILDSDSSPESFELLKKQQGHKNNLSLLRDARTRLKTYLQPTAQELENCHILTYFPTEDKAMTDSSDDEQIYSRATIEQRQDDLGKTITIGFKYLAQKYIKSKLKGLNSLFKQDALKKANKAAKGKAGVYELATADSKYIGQSKNTNLRINSRLAKDEKLRSADIKNFIRYDMPGSTKFEREVYAQFLINKYKQQQTTKILNPRDLIGGGRTESYNRTIEEVITKYNLPK